MADPEVQPDSQGATPAFDPAAFLNDVEARVAKVVDERAQKPGMEYPYGTLPRPAAPATPPAEDPMKALIDPYLAPMRQELAQAHLAAQAAEDRAAFYTQHPEIKPDSEAGQQIEKAFRNLAANGQAFTRGDIYQWVRGKEALKEDAERAARAKAESAVTVGQHSPPLSAAMDKDYFSMPDDQLKLEVTGKAF